ncbi:uncharacterized protein [Chelonus insularis]|uniref:uncharacterized protein n=1 Tax=Chelonus insularis TaxID=460826 RepID=UPI00158A5863|nr:uncharacterized protein LOC118069433 [Chelonus insularis]
MFQFWLFGVIILTAAISLNVVTGDNECDRKCRALGPITTIKQVPHSSSDKFCTCTPDVNAALGVCGLHETWSNVEKKCIPYDDIAKGCKANCPKDCETLIGHEDCSKYCHCNDGSSTVEECPSGFHFSKTKMICVPPKEAGCVTTGTIGSKSSSYSIRRSDSSSMTECIGTCPLMNSRTETVHLPHTNCQKFCKCNWGTPVVMDCPDNLHFNPTLQVCDWPFQAKSIISTAAVNSIVIESSSCIGKCVPPSPSIQYLPHQQCDKYCVCVSGQPEVFNCHFNKHWSREYEICTHPTEAKCQTSSNTTASSNALDQGCKTKCPQNESAFLAHNDCEKYCLCSNNSVTVFTCPNGHFSVKSNSCVSVADAGCITIDIRPDTTRVTRKSNTTSIMTDNECVGSCPELEDPSHTVYLAHHCNQVNSTTTIIIPPSDKALKKGCQTQCPRYNALVPHKDRHKFCLCRNGKIVILKCPRPYYFSTDHARCICTEKSQRTNLTRLFYPGKTTRMFSSTSLLLSTEPVPSSTEPSPPITTGIIEEFNNCVEPCPDINSDYYDHFYNISHKDCNKYCECLQGNITRVISCSADHNFDRFFRICDLKKYAECYGNDIFIPSNSLSSPLTSSLPITTGIIEEFNNCVEPCPDINSNYYEQYYNISHRDCNKYCECFKGNVTKVMVCSIDYNFDRFLRKCDFLVFVECDDDVSLLLTSTEPVSSSTEPSPPITTGIIEEFNNCVEPCPDINSDYYDHFYNISHKDCNKYCECLQGNITKVIECSADYNFDRFFRICDLKKYAECYGNDFFIPSNSLSSPLKLSPLITTGIKEEFNNCVEPCPDIDSDYYDHFYNISHRDCNKYCECFQGNIIRVMSCSADYNFDRFFRICDLEYFAECYGSDQFTFFSTLLSTSSTELPLFNQPTNDVNNCIGNCTQISSKNYDTAVNLPHENCNKYCECYRGEINVKECPLTYQFDWFRRECLTSSNASCLNHTLFVANPSLLSNSSSETPFITASPDFDNDDNCVETCPGINSVNYDEYVKIPHKNCKKYCECHRGILTVIDCPLDSYYDCYFQTCDVYKYATCYNQYTISAGPITSDPSAASPEIIENCIGKCSGVSKMNYAIFLKHKQCQKFCECFNGRLTVKSCPVHSYFNSNLGLCDQAKYVECPDTNKTSILSPISLSNTSDCIGVCVSDDVYLLPHKHRANYCECDLGFLSVKSCPSGTYFNDYTKRCEDTEFDDSTKISKPSITILSEYVEGCAEECPPFVDDNHVDFVPHKQCEKNY